MPPSNFVFVNAPALGVAGTVDDRRRIRSRLMRRLYVERQGEEVKLDSPEIGEHELVCESSCCRSSCRGYRPEKDSELVLVNQLSAEVCNRCGNPDQCPKRKGRSLKQKGNCKTLDIASMQLSSSKMDPFRADNMGGFEYDKLVNHLLRNLMPSLRQAQSWPRQCYQTYLQDSWSPLLINAVCLASSVHMERMAKNNGAINFPSRSLEQCRLKGLALQALRSAISQPIIGKASFDETVLAICLLAGHDNIAESMEKDYNPFQPPLRDLQALDFYGFSAFHPVHWKAIRDLVLQNGGLGVVKLYGTPFFLSYTSLKYAMFTLTKPAFPIVDPQGKPYGEDESPFQLLGITVQSGQKTCSGGFLRLQALHIRESIVRPFLDLAELAQGMQFFVSRQDDASAMDRFADTRNVVQHRLLSLPKPDDYLSWESIFEDRSLTNKRTFNVYSACWLAAIIFTTHVTFPIPRSRRVRESLVPKLQEAIGNSCLPGDENGVADVLLWCAVVGGIAAEDGTPACRDWFVGQVRRLCETLHITTWTEVRQLMQYFAWMDSACDAGGLILWEESQVEDYRAPMTAHVEYYEIAGHDY